MFLTLVAKQRGVIACQTLEVLEDEIQYEANEVFVHQFMKGYLSEDKRLKDLCSKPVLIG